MQRSLIHRSKRAAIAVIGSAVILIGLVLIPYPGPGWLIVFAGLAIMATEFAWAQRVLDYARGKYDSWLAWLGRQNICIKVLFSLITAIIVVATIWLLNGYSLINDWLHLGLDWLRSPLF